MLFFLINFNSQNVFAFIYTRFERCPFNMSLSGITTSSVWLNPTSDITTLNANITNLTATNNTIANETVTNLTVSTKALVGNSTQTNSSYLTVGNTSANKGITFLNNISGYTPTDLSTYMESSEAQFTYIAESGEVSVYCSNDYRRIGKTVTLFLGGFTMIDAGSTRWQSQTAIPAIYRPGADIYTTCVANFNNIPKIGYMRISTAGIVLLQFDFSTSGGTNGLLNATVSYNV